MKLLIALDKVLVRLYMLQVHIHLLKSYGSVLFRFTHTSSNTNQILALRILMKRNREFGQKVLNAYINFRKACVQAC